MAKKTKNFSGHRIVKFDVPSHPRGGAYLNILGDLTKDKDEAVIEIEKKESVSKNNNGDLFVYSDKLGSNKIAEETDNIKGDTKLARKTRKLILNDAQRFNQQELQKELEQDLNNAIPQAELGADIAGLAGSVATGGLTAAIPYGVGLVTDAVTDFFQNRKQASNIPMQNNTNPYVVQMKNGGKVKTVPKYEDGGPRDFDPLQPIQTLQPIPTNNIPLGRQEMNLPKLGNTIPSSVSMTNPTGINAKALPAEFTNGYGVPYSAEDLATQSGSANKFNLPDALNIGSFIGSAALSFQSPEKEQLQLPNFNEGNQLAANTGIDPTALINQNNQAYSSINEAARRASGTVGQYLNRLRGSAGNLARANDQALLTAKQYNDQVSLQRAGRADRIATINSQERIRQQTANSQNQAMSQDQMQNFFNQMSSIGNGLDRKKAIEKATSEMNTNQKRQFLLNLATLSLVNPNFKPGANIQWTIDNIDTLPIDQVINNLVQFKE